MVSFIGMFQRSKFIPHDPGFQVCSSKWMYFFFFLPRKQCLIKLTCPAVHISLILVFIVFPVLRRNWLKRILCIIWDPKRRVYGDVRGMDTLLRAQFWFYKWAQNVPITIPPWSKHFVLVRIVCWCYKQLYVFVNNFHSTFLSSCINWKAGHKKIINKIIDMWGAVL